MKQSCLFSLLCLWSYIAGAQDTVVQSHEKTDKQDQFSWDIITDDPQQGILLLAAKPLIALDPHQWLGLGIRLDVGVTSPQWVRADLQLDYGLWDIMATQYDSKKDYHSGDYTCHRHLYGLVTWLFSDQIQTVPKSLEITQYHHYSTGQKVVKSTQIPLKLRTMSGIRLGYYQHDGTLHSSATSADYLRVMDGSSSIYLGEGSSRGGHELDGDAYVDFHYQGFVVGYSHIKKRHFEVNAEWANDQEGTQVIKRIKQSTELGYYFDVLITPWIQYDDVSLGLSTSYEIPSQGDDSFGHTPVGFRAGISSHGHLLLPYLNALSLETGLYPGDLTFFLNIACGFSILSF